MHKEEVKKFLGDVKESLRLRRAGKKNTEALKHFPLAKHQAVYVLDFKTQQVLFQNGVESFLGYKPVDFTFEKVINYYHPDDNEMVSRLLRATLLYTVENPISDENVAYFITHRIRKKDGSYIKVLRQSAVFEKDKSGKLISNISIISDISFIDTSDKVQWKFDAPGLDQKKFRKCVGEEYSDFFSKREEEVLRYLSLGHTSSDIAASLHISKHTVDGHRRNMLHKSHSSNTVELIHFSKTNGIL